jgi:hypothetical protein
VRNYAGFAEESLMEESKHTALEAIQSVDGQELSESRSEAATTHVDSDILGKTVSDYMIPWVERVVQDNKLFDYVK